MPQLARIGGLMGAPKPGRGVSAPAWALSGASLDIDFAGNRAWGSGIGETTPGAILTMVRASSSNLAIAAANTWSSFSANALRQTDLGILIERSRTNVLLHSTDLTNAAWVATSATMTGGQAAPDGTTNAATMLDPAASSQHRILNSSASFTNGTSYFFSVRAKSGTGSFIQLTFNASQFTGAGYANFDLSGGTVSASGGTLVGSGIVDEGGGWYNCWISATATANGSNGLLIARVSSGTSARAEVYTGTATTVFLWNPCVNVTTLFPSSPIYTVASSVLRNSDNITPNAAAKTLMDAAKSAYSETRRLQGGSSPLIVDFGGTASLRAAAGPTGTTVSTLGASTATATIGGSGNTFGLVKAAFSFDGSNNKAIANGGTQATTAGAWGVTTETPQIGNLAALTSALEGYLGRLAFSANAGNFDALTV